MNYNERKFNMDIAAVCGLREAVIVDFIRGWLLTSDETTYRHGHLWVKCTQKTMTVHLPFLTESMVRNSIRKLVKKGIITMERLLELIVYTPRKRFGIPLSESDYSLWDLETETVIDSAEFLSKGKATPFDGWKVYGTCLKTVVNGNVVYEAEGE